MATSSAFAAFAAGAQELTPRARGILDRLPAHLEASRGGKLLGFVTEGLASDIDILSAAIGAIRRAHRLSDADELRDLLLIGGLHGIDLAELAVAMLRAKESQRILGIFETKLGGPDESDSAEALCALWGLAEAPPLLALFAAPGEPDGAGARLAAQAREALGTGVLLDAVRTRIAVISAIHVEGNGTIKAVLTAAANALDLDIGGIVHSADRYWHAAPVRDRWALHRMVPGATPQAPARRERIEPAEEVVGIEENPQFRMAPDEAPRRHGELFTVLRRGFDRAKLQVRITGELDHTMAPMLVNRDEGQGIGFDSAVPGGAVLMFDEVGRAFLDGADVTSLAYGWRGACFAGPDASAARDFVFADEGQPATARQATFVVTGPAAALDREASFPSAGADVEPLGVAVGETRFAFFVREAHFGVRYDSGGATISRTTTPRSTSGLFDESVWAAGPDESLPFAATVGLSWLDHQPFRARLLVPARFRALTPDDTEGTAVLRSVALAVERVRPVGVDLLVEFIDDRWVLGEAVLSSAAGDDLIDRVRSGTSLWASAPADGPSE